MLPRNLRESQGAADIHSEYYQTYLNREAVKHHSNVSPLKSAAKMHLRSDASEIDNLDEQQDVSNFQV